jgi:ParB family chromosome partitioning protein
MLRHDARKREEAKRAENEASLKAAEEARRVEAEEWAHRAEKRRQSPVLQSTSVEHYTPARFIEAARRVLGRQIDLDPCSCEEANKTVKAVKFYDEETDGLKQEWRGRVWLNPPYNGSAQPFVERLRDRIASKDVTAAVVLLNSNSTDSKWFRPLWDGVLCFCYDRIRFDGPGNGNGPTHGSVLVYFGPHPEAFAKEFQQFGAVMSRYKGGAS